MSQFQKPALTDNDIVNVIQTLYMSSNNEINGIMISAYKTANDEKLKRLKGKFGGQVKNSPTKKEALAMGTALLGEEFLKSREKQDDFDPYEFMGVKNPALEPA